MPAECLAAAGRDGKRAGAGEAPDPAFREAMAADGGPEPPGDMDPSFAPIEAGPAERPRRAPGAGTGPGEHDAEGRKQPLAAAGEQALRRHFGVALDG